jgi:hypothetical protein
MLKLVVESFLTACCESAIRSVFVLPEGSNIFRKLGKEAICYAVSSKASDVITTEIDELYSDLKETKTVVEEYAKKLNQEEQSNDE